MKKTLAFLLVLASCQPAFAQTVERPGPTTDFSGTVTVGGTSQQVMGVNSNRRYLMCQNPIAASEALYINFGAPAVVAGAGGSIELAPGDTLTMADGFITSDFITVNAATTAHRFVCKQG